MQQLRRKWTERTVNERMACVLQTQLLREAKRMELDPFGQKL